MSEDKLKRRRFLADMLFAGGALTGLAWLAEHGLIERVHAEETPAVAGTPAPPVNPNPSAPYTKGDARAPVQCTPSLDPEAPNPRGGARAPIQPAPAVRGESVAPVAPARTPRVPQNPHIDGDYEPPRKKP
jgi:hypothetical protein